MPAIPLEYAAYYLIAVNFVAFASFGIDKALAEGGRRRISEDALLTWAFIGGTPGAYAGRHLFRHKTRKRSFSNALHTVAAWQVVLIAGAAYYFGLHQG
ncbi:DUF1294 domain-containing protein [Aurantiacibacter gangjinensis]|uniref:Uncharacterized protein n=1 Tax=Aurantiacibacter gangjinensis TaxID=502682 RepID=A0A0G9MKX6_9SPHN|nr:DUF1294 domain-containing protein [Aurantiacibacter gangjinensis]APE27211.1 hypothetical protein BMF35_a0382 [Aurantiacibacter gangjinensis]KLE31337.1 hypothetical protein AAW01_06925 [Aurantiacibacter gangjinensis]